MYTKLKSSWNFDRLSILQHGQQSMKLIYDIKLDNLLIVISLKLILSLMLIMNLVVEKGPFYLSLPSFPRPP